MSKPFKSPPHCKGIDDHQKYLSRITKTLYYGKLPKNDMLSLPVTELAVEIFSGAQKGKSLERLHLDTAAQISRNACVSPCSLVLAMLYFERLKKCNVDYLERTVPSDLFLVSLMVSSKFLFDDGEIDEVFMDEWAASSGLTCKELALLERNFLRAIDWQIFSNKDTFWRKLGDIEMQLALKEGGGRGHFTYTELETLAELIGRDLHSIVQCIVAFSVILAATYTAALLTLVGSVALASTIPGTSLYQSKICSSNVAPITEGAVVLVVDTINVTAPVTYDETKSTPRHNAAILNLNAVKVFKASILLASITANGPANSSETASTTAETLENDCQNVTWDWWTVPVMTWLWKTSEYIKNLEIPVVPAGYVYFLENTATNEKFACLSDHIEKATKTRIQDQLERSWHAEWTDTIRRHVSNYNILSYLQSIKP